MYEYIKNGKDIYERSFAIIRQESSLDRFSGLMEKVAVRMIHACGRPALASQIQFSQNAAEIGHRALQQGAAILCDSKMVMQGITKARLPAENKIFCYLDDDRTPDLAKKLATTRSAAAIELWKDQLKGSIAVIGNAPTALFHLLEMIAQGSEKPALIIGIPVGFVGAAESKLALSNNKDNLPFITVTGREGGSAIAVAALNALAQESEL